MALEPLCLRLDRIAGCKQAGVAISEDALTHPKTRRAYSWVMWLLCAEIMHGIVDFLASDHVRETYRDSARELPDTIAVTIWSS